MNNNDFIDTITGLIIPYEELITLIRYPMCQIIGRYGVWELKDEDRLYQYIMDIRKQQGLIVCDYD